MATFAAARRASLETRRAVAFRGFGGSVRLYSSPPAAAAEKPGADTPGAIFKTSVANKIGLAHALDGVMRSGAHDMKVSAVRVQVLGSKLYDLRHTSSLRSRVHRRTARVASSPGLGFGAEDL